MTTFIVNNMTCGSCAKHITHAVKALDPDATLAIDLPSRQVNIQSTKTTDELITAIRAMDYDVAVANE